MDLENLKVLAQAATPGVWVIDGVSHEAIHIACRSGNADLNGYRIANVIDSNGYPVNSKNAEFIAAAGPDVVLSLISEIEELRAHAEALANSLSDLRALPGIPLKDFEASGRVLFKYQDSTNGGK